MPVSIEALSRPRHDWTREEILQWMDLPLMRLVWTAQSVHRLRFPDDEVQLCTLLSVKTGGCSEDCAYCPQSARYDVALDSHPLLDTQTIVSEAQKAKERGSTRFCMGAAWRSVPERESEFERILDAVRAVRSLGLEVCVTLGMLTYEQAVRLKEAGVHAYNHNLDTSPEFYPQIITTRTYQDRLETLQHVRRAGMTVCCGGIVGMGESRDDRAGLLRELTHLRPHPESVPINLLVRVPGTPLENVPPLDEIELVRTIAAARIVLPTSRVRLSAGRTEMSDSLQALCFLAGANSIFTGDRLLTTPNPGDDADAALLRRLGMKPAAADEEPVDGRSEISLP